MDEIKRQCLRYFEDEVVQSECKLVLDKVVQYIGRKIWPYVVFAGSVFVAVLVVLTYTVYRVNALKKLT